MTKKLYGSDLMTKLANDRQRVLGIMAERNGRINEGLTDDNDCFMSIKMDKHQLREIEMQMEILAGDGLYEVKALFDEDGDEVAMRWVNTRYGTRVVADGVFAKTVEALVEKTGYELRTIKAPCWTKFMSSGTGLCGAYTGYYVKTRWHTNMTTGEYVGYPN